MSQPPSAPPATLKASPKPTWLRRNLITVIAFTLGLGAPFAPRIIPESMGSISAGEWLAVLAGALFLAILSHECGHLVAAWLVRFEVSAFVIGPVGLHRKPDGWKCMFNRHLGQVQGFVGIRPRSYEHIRRRLNIFIIGGPLGNLAAAGVCSLLLLQAQNPLPAHFYLVMATFSLLFGLVNCIPSKNHIFQSDGARLLMLRRQPQQAERWIAMSVLSGALLRGVRPRDWDAAAVERAAAYSDRSQDHINAMLLAYMWAEDREDYDQAQGYLDPLLADHSYASPYNQAVILIEGAFFYSYQRRNLALAHDYWNQLKPIAQHIPHQILVYTRTTLLAAQGRLDEARERLKEYMQVRKEHPYAWMREGEAKWLARMHSTLNVAEAPASS